jgi:hypothetical protein
MESIGIKLSRMLALLCCLVMPLSYAQQAPPEPDRYREALELLEHGDRNGAIDRYNRLLEDMPNHAGAWLDLALLYCEQGLATRAHQIFDHIEKQFEPPRAILELIRHYRSEGCAFTPVPSERWTLSLSGGHTDNVNHGLSNPVIDFALPLGVASVRLGETFLPRASALAAVSGSYVKEIQSLPGTMWFAGFTEKRFPNVQEFNQRSLLTGVLLQRAFGNWLQETELVATHLSLNEHTHQTGLLAQGTLWLPPLSESAPRFGVEIAASRWRYPKDPLYDSTIAEGGVSGKWVPIKRIVLRGAVGPLFDFAARQRPGLDRHGYHANLSGQWIVSDEIRLDGSYRYRVLKDDAAYSPLFGERKHQSTQSQLLMAIQAKTSVSSPATWRLEWEQSQSRDNIPLFPYTSRTLTLSWQYQWGTF